MEESLSLSWDAHQSSICNGLSLLQQRGEFVDMTLAADGHHVKVHQMVMSLVSPYIKELISSAQCPHPVIFLNNISYTTLCAILEYIYTGEVFLPKEKLPDLLAAGKALHIKGLREMGDDDPIQSADDSEKDQPNSTVVDKLQEYKKNNKYKSKLEKKYNTMSDIFVNDNGMDQYMDMGEDVEVSNTENDETFDTTAGSNNLLVLPKNKEYGSSNVQYSISNQGNLQVIINRYIYNLKYVQKNLNRYWRCVDYAYRKCPANVYTNDKNQVLKRKCTHNHPYHDVKILKKINAGLVYSAYNEAETKAKDKKTEIIEIIGT